MDLRSESCALKGGASEFEAEAGSKGSCFIFLVFWFFGFFFFKDGKFLNFRKSSREQRLKPVGGDRRRDMGLANRGN